MEAEHGQLVQDPLHAEAFAWLLSALTPEERDEFVRDFRSLAERLRNVAQEIEETAGGATPPQHLVKEFSVAYTDLAIFTQSWSMSIRLAESETWRSQVASARSAWSKVDGLPTSDDLVDGMGLKKALSI